MLLECSYSGPRAQSRRLPFPPCAPRGLLARGVCRGGQGVGQCTRALAVPGRCIVEDGSLGVMIRPHRCAVEGAARARGAEPAPRLRK